MPPALGRELPHRRCEDHAAGARPPRPGLAHRGPKLYDHDRAYIFQNADNRIIFAIPYERDFTLIGTTDQDYQGDPGAVRITPAEIDYLCAAASEYIPRPHRPRRRGLDLFGRAPAL